MNLFRPSGSFGTGLLVGLGASMLLPLAARVLAGAGKPLLKESIKGGVLVMDKGRELYSETKGSLSEATTEAKSEAEAATKPSSTSTSTKAS